VIDKSGRWWIGDSADDLDEFLRAFAAGGYALDRATPSTCEGCGAVVFRLFVDDDAGCARRTCIECHESKALLDSVDQEDEAEPEQCACPCGGEHFHLAIGFAVRDDGDIPWVSIGGRCVTCGVLGCYTDWKIDYSPTEQLYGLT